jgi:hypothetical protein
MISFKRGERRLAKYFVTPNSKFGVTNCRWPVSHRTSRTEPTRRQRCADHKLVQIREELPTDPAFEAVIVKYHRRALEARSRHAVCAVRSQQKTVRTSMKVFHFLSALSFTVLTVVLPTADATRNRMAVIEIVGFNDVYEMLHDDVYGFMVSGPSRVIPIVMDTR